MIIEIEVRQERRAHEVKPVQRLELLPTPSRGKISSRSVMSSISIECSGIYFALRPSTDLNGDRGGPVARDRDGREEGRVGKREEEENDEGAEKSHNLKVKLTLFETGIANKRNRSNRS